MSPTRLRRTCTKLIASLIACGAIPPEPARAQDDFDAEFETTAEDNDWERDFQREQQERAAETKAPATRTEDSVEISRATHNTWDGPTGGLRVVGAGSGRTGRVRLQLLTEFFSTGDFLIADDEHEHTGGSVSASWTLTDYLEVFTSLSATSDSNPFERPSLFQKVGDWSIGAKGFLYPAPWFAVGGDVTLHFLTDLEQGIAWSATGVRGRANATADLRQLDSPVPFIARLTLGYAFDNSHQLVEELEQERYDALPDAASFTDETRHLVNAVERFGLGINRTDFLDVGVGLEAPLLVSETVAIHPLLEWTLRAPVNRQGFDCPLVRLPDGSRPPGDEGCLDREGLAAIPMQLTFGVRLEPGVTDLALLIGLDVGLTGTSPRDAVRELAATPPWNLVVGASYNFDVIGPQPEVQLREVVVEEEVPEPPPPRGRIRGSIIERESTRPVPHARVEYLGQGAPAQQADEQGRFVSDDLPPGPVSMFVTANAMKPNQCDTEIAPAGGDVDVRCELVRKPLVVVEESEIQILEQIHFAFDSDVILERSVPLMTEIARTMNENVQLLRIEIQGHTDSEGTPEYNQQLSDRRAEAVRRWLVDHGVADGRLTAAGYGLTRPVAPNDSDANRARNRRVQFIIRERADDGAPTLADEPPEDNHER